MVATQYWHCVRATKNPDKMSDRIPFFHTTYVQDIQLVPTVVEWLVKVGYYSHKAVNTEFIFNSGPSSVEMTMYCCDVKAPLSSKFPAF